MANETMARIKIEDLSVTEDLSEKELKGIFGGAFRRTRATYRVRQFSPPRNRGRYSKIGGPSAGLGGIGRGFGVGPCA